MKKITYLTVLALGIVLISCGKYREYDNMDVVDNTYAGNMIITSTGETPAGDFEGDGEGGTYSFAYENPKEKAQVNFDITSPAGSIQMIIRDSKGDEVLNETRNGSGDDTFAGPTAAGKKGVWLIEIILTNVEGDGSFSISPID